MCTQVAHRCTNYEDNSHPGPQARFLDQHISNVVSQKDCHDSNTSYNERLHYLGLSNLELQCLHLDLIHCYKIVFGVVDLNFSDFF